MEAISEPVELKLSKRVSLESNEGLGFSFERKLCLRSLELIFMDRAAVDSKNICQYFWEKSKFNAVFFLCLRFQRRNKLLISVKDKERHVFKSMDKS